MFRKAIVIGIFVIAATGAFSQDPRDIPRCKPTPAFSFDTVHRICSLGTDGFLAADAKWHKTEPYFAVLSYRHRAREVAIVRWRFFGERDFRGWHLSEYSHSFVQMEIAQDMVIAGTSSGSLSVWDLLQDTFLYEVQIAEGLVSELLTHPSEEWLLVAIDHEKLFRFEFASQSVSEIKLQRGGDLSLGALAFSDDGRLLASGGNEIIQIWDTDSWEAVAAADLGAESPAELMFIAGDSQLIVLADASVSRWSLSGKDLNLLRELEAHPDKRPCRITVGDISPDETLLMTNDSCVQKRAWDLTTDTEIFVPRLDYPPNYDVQGTVSLFSLDGHYYLSGGDYSSWAFWVVGPEE